MDFKHELLERLPDWGLKTCPLNRNAEDLDDLRAHPTLRQKLAGVRWFILIQAAKSFDEASAVSGISQSCARLRGSFLPSLTTTFCFFTQAPRCS
ncbi:hypothetical protein Thiowin_03501 [Thiorhodovibrio winogradskyi]|uniref:Uncharacterized protein n=1 Tax=Thiorhodovibrio winogradskyi TaxID=77007 RepID=A0ABZ0SBL9_9GAMM|nr:hypothetical protein [Thiorhodovibrio winogradskyi]